MTKQHSLSTHCPDAILGMIQSGILSRLSGSAIKVYLAIKVASNKPLNQATIADQVGLSISQVKRCIQSLEAAGCMTVSKAGRINYYTLG